MDAGKERNMFTAWFVSKPKSSGLLVFFLLFGVVIYIVGQRYQIIKENDKREMSNILHVVYQNIEQSLKNSGTAALTLALTIDDDGNPQHFDAVGKQLLTANPGIDAVQLVPNGVIRYVYPLEGNKPALGFDIFKSPENREDAVKAMSNKKMYFAGPLELQQGGMGVIGRLPVYLNGKFWGFSGILVRMENLMKMSGIQSIDDSKYYFQFSHSNTLTEKEEFFLPVTEDFSGKYFQVVTFPDSDWKLYIITKDDYAILYQLMPLFLAGSLLAMLFGMMISMLLKKPAQLQLLVLKQARKISQSQAKYKSMFDQAAMGIAHIDTATGKFLEVNDQYCKMLGYSREEIREMDFMHITHPDDLMINLSHMESLKCAQIAEYSLEKRYLTKKGKVLWVNLTVSPLWAPGESPTTHLAIIEDITLKKEAKEQIAKSEARFKSLFEDSPVALWEEDFSEVKKYITAQHPEINAENATAFFEANPNEIKTCVSLIKIIDVNNACIKLHKQSTKKQLVEVNLVALLDEDSTQSFVRQLSAVVAGETMIEMNTRIKNLGDGHRDIFMRWNVMRGYEDTLERIIVSTEDITAQKESERIIIQSQEKIEDLVNSVDGIVWECDTSETFKLTFMSRKVEDILGFTPEEWAADDYFWEKHIHPEDKQLCQTILQNVAREKKRMDFEYRMIAKDGSLVWIQDFMNMNFKDGKPERIRGIMIDVTKTKQAEQDLSNSLDLVTEQKMRLMNFSYIVSHNLRSHTANMQSIITFIETADSDAERNEMIGMLKTVGGSLNETMENLNDLVNIQTNVTLQVETLPLNQYIENTKKVLSEKIDSYGVTINNHVKDDISVDYNPAYLESILLNLVSNAIRYAHPERKPILDISWLMEDDKNVLKVSDNGIGIDLKKYGEKLFGMYKTFHGNSDARGIGLFMTKSQVEAMGGSIAVESEPGKGTTFLVYFKPEPQVTSKAMA